MVDIEDPAELIDRADESADDRVDGRVNEQLCAGLKQLKVPATSKQAPVLKPTKERRHDE